MIGQGSNFSGFSYLTVGRETTYGTYNTCTCGLEFSSLSIKTMKEGKILEEVQRSRTYSNRISLGKKIEGECEAYFRPDSTACAYLLENAMGGSVTSTELTAGAAYSHEFKIGAMDLTNLALSFNVRKGESASAKIFEYSGARINEFGLVAELDESLKMTFGTICKDSTQTANDISASITIPACETFTFDNGRFSIADSTASLTASSYWHVQNIEFSIGNSLKADNDSRRIGSDTIEVLPVGIAVPSLKVGMRFDTTTAYDAMLSGAAMSGEFEFLGNTLAGSDQRKSLTIDFAKLYISEAGDPEIGGPDEMLKSEVTFDVLRDCSSATGYAIKATLVNGMASI